MRRRHSRDQWLAWLTEQRQSGVTVSAFCRQNQISEKSFYAWRRKLAGLLSSSAKYRPMRVTSVLALP